MILADALFLIQERSKTHGHILLWWEDEIVLDGLNSLCT
jgi:hypothetical protein